MAAKLKFRRAPGRHPSLNPFSRSALLTDLYEVTMAYGYWKSERADLDAAFHLYFRNHPFNGGFTIASGLADVIEYLKGFQFEAPELDYVGGLKGDDGRPLFDRSFLRYLARLKFACDVDAIPEGTVVFPQEPLVRVRGPILQAQLVETALLNFVNFQSLIATKAARVCLAAESDPVIEFGLRRAQGVDGGFSAARATYIGGCVGTSNLLAGHVLGIPVKGTHAHSWVLAFEDELAAFEAYADALPNNCTLLVDTYDSLEGVRHAVEVGRRLGVRGGRLGGIRLDSGDLAYLSIEARKILDAAGFRDTVIVGSNDLDEYLIASLKQQKAAINVWGVGTKLVTAFDQPALGGVYKLSALRGADGRWRPRLKVSDEAAKVTNPGILQVRRFRGQEGFVGDAIYDETRRLPNRVTIVDPVDPTRRKQFLNRRTGVLPVSDYGDRQDACPTVEDLLVPVFRKGKLVYSLPVLDEIKSRVRRQLDSLHPGIKRFSNPHRYPAGLELSLYELKTRLILRRTRG
ncbi:MAG TPA: nicotinate phosphoribosyltransferase [Verrucomicrobiae bacterium]